MPWRGEESAAAEAKSVCFCAFRDTSSSDSEDSSDSSDDELIGPPLPPKTVGEPVHTVDEDILGPLPPPLGEEGEDDDDDDLEDEGEEEVSIQRLHKNLEELLL